MSTAILKNTLSGETIFVKKVKGRIPRGRKIFDVWIDNNNQPLCVVGNEEPNWKVLVLNKENVHKDSESTPKYPIGDISR